MTKKELIKVEWIKIIGEEKYEEVKEDIDINGLIEFFDLNIVEPGQLEELADFNTKVRPKSLHRIEDNNGWIKIESKDDLPNIEGNYICGKMNSLGKFTELKNKLSLHMLIYNYEYDILTHYKLYKPTEPKY